MKIIRKALEQLLLATRREQNINGKSQTQVDSCVLRLEKNVLSTTSIVKDGKTSLSRFSFTTDEQEDSLIPVADIERMLGVLKYHGDYVTLSIVGDEKNKVRVKSNKKQTTLVGGMKAKAYSNSQHILEEYEQQAVARAKQIKGNVQSVLKVQKVVLVLLNVSILTNVLIIHVDKVAFVQHLLLILIFVLVMPQLVIKVVDQKQNVLKLIVVQLISVTFYQL